MEVNAMLYDFLKENETGITHNEHGVVVYVHVPFHELADFVDIVGGDWFSEGGIEGLLFNETICIDLNNIIEGKGHRIISYKNCFDEYDLKRYKKELLAMS